MVDITYRIASTNFRLEAFGTKVGIVMDKDFDNSVDEIMTKDQMETLGKALIAFARTH
jgi:hypothetical protein